DGACGGTSYCNGKTESWTKDSSGKWQYDAQPTGGKGGSNADASNDIRACRCGRRPPLIDSSGKPTGAHTSGGSPVSRKLILSPAPSSRAEVEPATEEQRQQVELLKNIDTGLKWARATGGGTLSQRVAGVIYETAFSVADYHTRGVCVSGSVGIVAGVSGQYCAVIVATPENGYRVGHTKSVGWGTEDFKFGASVLFHSLRSNADDIGQLGGAGHDIGGSVRAGYGVGANHETAIRTNNSRGQQVSAIDFALGWGLGLDINTGINHAWSEWGIW
ncbi:hypothetical protein, partial [Streptomyces sp. PR69]|uniref:hypothetical protein n=1 Tax=Streptomyces sp. PR69 TaxID=2984950 RepID=UPI0022649962